MAENKRRDYEQLRAQLENERSTFIPHWRELSENILPRRSRFFTSDANKGDRRNQKIIDSTATLAARTLRSGMMGGITSPARPWFRLSTPDPDLAEFGSVKEWLYLVSQRMATVFLKSNIYNIKPLVYGDLGVFGTAPMSIEEDFKNVIRANSFPVGSYMIAKDYRGVVNVFFREFRMTVDQLISQFGRKDDKSGKIDWSNFSDTVKSLYDSNQTQTWIDVCHVIKPNEEYDQAQVHSKFKKFTSCYYEKGTGLGEGNYMNGSMSDSRLLREKGYDYFPVLCPRWEVTGEDVYGTDCPGMVALGDIKQLQQGEKRLAQAIDKMVNPPMVGPPELRNQKASLLHGEITYLNQMNGAKAFHPAHEVNPQILNLDNKQQQIRQRISRAFYEDLFLMMANMDRRDITATEIDERKEEKLLALGPVLEQLNQDMLDPEIDITFDLMLRQGLIPPAPKELQGVQLKVEYISIMAQAQKLIGISSVERFSGFVGQLAQAVPDTLHKINVDQIVDVYGDMTSIPPGIIRTDEEAAQIRQGIQQAQQQQQQAEVLKQGAGAARDLANTDLSKDSVLNRLLEQSKAGQAVPQ